MLQYLVLYMCLCSCLTIQAPICTPTITEGKIGKPEIGGFISLECEIATCNNPTKIVFEKTDLNATWIPVFEGISTTQYKALDTAVGYTLENRNFYYAFRTSVHSLHIVPLILKDHGEWRCCVYDVTEKKYNSGQVDVNVYVSPALDKFNITSNNSHVLFHQTKEFTCVVDGIHPEPEVLWRLNGVAHKGNTISQQRTDQLWVVRNTIRLRFDTLGVNELNCVLKAKAKDPWMEYHINITVQVQPAVEDFYISPNSSHLVVGQTKEFTCVVDGIHPEPEVLWKVNGVEHTGNATNKQREDKIWVVMTTIRLQWDTRGVNKLKCVIKTKSRDPWLENLIDITVQEKAVVLYPIHDITLTVDVDATFSLRCSVSGHNPRITWERNGKDCLSNNTRYVMKDDCDNAKCDSSIASKQMDLALACDDKEEYSGVYTCIVALEPPYQSSETSSNMNVTILKRHCSGNTKRQTVGVSMLSALGVALIATGIGSLLYLKKRRKKQANKDEEALILMDDNTTTVDIDFYKSLEAQETIIPTYETAVYLKKCDKKPSDDKLVLFDFLKDRIFIHDMSDLNKYKEYKCDMNILDMIRTSHNRFVVTEYITRHIHLLHLKDGTFYNLDTIKKKSKDGRPLICADNDTSFILCYISGHEPFDINIFRVDITNDQPKQNNITKVTLNTWPTYVSLTPDRNILVMVNERATIYSVNLDSHAFNEDHNMENKEVDGWVRSLYIDWRANIIIGDRSQINIYTHDKKRYVLQRVCERVRGVTVDNERVIVNYGRNGKQQYIRVYKNDNLAQFPHVEENISEGINFYKSMEEHDTIKPEYKTAVYLKKCFDRQDDNKLVLFDCQTNRIFIHEMSDLTRYQEYKCAMNILDMIRTSPNRFVVTEYINRHIHLLQFKDGKFLRLNTLSQNFDDWHALICAYTDNSFIWCDLEGHDPFVIEISRVDIINDKLITNRITDVTLNTRPRYISAKSDNTMLVLVNDRATIYKVDPESYTVEEDHTMENKDVDGWARSLYIDPRDNIIIGDGSQINVYTHNKRRCIVPRVGKSVRGVTVSNGRIIVNCGHEGQQQYIKVFKPNNSTPLFSP